MSAAFDPYHKWLGIPPEEQPPDDYRLLGLRKFESDSDAIANAADRQTLLLRTLQSGQHRLECQRLLNEVSAARVRLLDRQKKLAYDEQLRAELAEHRPPPPAPAPLPVARAIGDAEFAAARESIPGLGTESRSTLSPHSAEILPSGAIQVSGVRLRRKKSWMPLAVTVVTALAIVAGTGIYFGIFAEREPPELPDPVAKADTSGTTEQIETPLQTPAAEVDPVASQESSSASEPPVEKVEPPADPVAVSADETTGEGATAETDEPPSPSEPELAPMPPQPETAESPTEPPGKRPPPDEHALATARQTVREIFPKEFEKVQTPEDRVALARFLMAQAAQIKDDPLGRYALLFEAIEQSIEVGNFAIVQESVDALSADWEVDRLRILGRALVAAARSPHAPPMRDELANVALGLVEEALQARRYDGADQIAGIADGLAAKARDAELRRKTRAAVARAGRLKRDWEKVLTAQKMLETEPQNAEANYLVGKYLCLESGDAAKGLAHLAQGSHAELQKLAQRDLEEQQQPAEERAEEKVALADEWSALAESDEDLAGFQARAHHWYEKAAPIATGLIKTKAERRRDELASDLEVQRLRAVQGAVGRGQRIAGPLDVQLDPRDTLAEHKDVVTRVAFSPRGALLATAGNDNTAQVWDYEREKLLVTMPHKANVQALAWSFDGRFLATGSRDTIQIWDAIKNRIARPIPVALGRSGVTDVAFAPGGATLVFCGADALGVRFWNLKTFTPAGELPYRRARAVQVTPEGLIVIGGEDEKSTSLWSVGREVLRRFPTPSPVHCLAVSPDGRFLATGGPASRIRVFNLHSGNEVATLADAFGGCVAWSPDGALLAVCGNDASVLVYDTYDWSLRQRGASSSGRIGWVSFSADGKTLAGCGGDAVVRLWNVRVSPRKAGTAPETLASNPAAPASAINPPATDPAPTENAAQQARILVSLRPHAAKDPQSPVVRSSVLSLDGLWLATGGADRAVQLLDVAKGALSGSYLAHGGPVTALALDAKGETLASADDTGQVRLVAFPEFAASGSLNFESPVEHLIFTEEGGLILGARDGRLQQWSTQAKSKTFDFQGHTDAISGLAITPNGKTLISTGRDGKMIAWNLVNRVAPPQVLRSETLPIESLDLSPEGDSAAFTIPRAGRVIVYNLATQKSVALNTAGGQITAVAFMPDNRTLVIGDSGGGLHLFDREAGQRLLALAHPGSAVHRLLLSGDGSRLASISIAGEVKVWEMPAVE